MPLTLLLPDLLLPVGAPPALRALRLPSLEKWLGRATLERVPARGAWDWLAAAHAIAPPCPYAAISLAGEANAPSGFPPDAHWMRADPVHMRIERDLVGLRDASILEVTSEEAGQLVAALQALFGSDGLEFIAATPDRWYVRLPEGIAPATTPLAEAIGRDIFALLPQGGGLNWRSAITEAQMLMSNHAVNVQRERDGRPAINSVWFWGEGKLPSQSRRAFASVFSDHPFAIGLGRLGGSRVLPPVESAAAMPAGAKAEDSLVVLDALTAPLRRGEEAAWIEGARAIDAAWFANLGRTITRFGGVRVVLPRDADCLVATLEPRSRWRVLNSRKVLATLA